MALDKTIFTENTVKTHHVANSFGWEYLSSLSEAERHETMFAARVFTGALIWVFGTTGIFPLYGVFNRTEGAADVWPPRFDRLGSLWPKIGFHIMPDVSHEPMSVIC